MESPITVQRLAGRSRGDKVGDEGTGDDEIETEWEDGSEGSQVDAMEWRVWKKSDLSWLSTSNLHLPSVMVDSNTTSGSSPMSCLWPGQCVTPSKQMRSSGCPLKLIL